VLSVILTDEEKTHRCHCSFLPLVFFGDFRLNAKHGCQALFGLNLLRISNIRVAYELRPID
jgi:hypothetical protein